MFARSRALPTHAQSPTKCRASLLPNSPNLAEESKLFHRARRIYLPPCIPPLRRARSAIQLRPIPPRALPQGSIRYSATRLLSLRPVEMLHVVHVDRKSTRLNSSHLG